MLVVFGGGWLIRHQACFFMPLALPLPPMHGGAVLQQAHASLRKAKKKGRKTHHAPHNTHDTPHTIHMTHLT